jgi:transposase-like protein
MKIRSLSPEERRRLVAFGVHAGKSNRAIARELEVDEGTVRRDRKYLATPGRDRQVKKARSRKPKTPKPMYTVDDRATVIRHKGRVLRAVKHWIEEKRGFHSEIETVLHEADRQLFQGRALMRRMPIPTQKPEELLLPTRPNSSKWEDHIPNPDYFAEWLARWLAVCLPAQEDLHDEILGEISQWARDRAAGSVY